MPVKVFAGPFSIDGSPVHVEPLPATGLGDHTYGGLGPLGYDNGQLEVLRPRNVIT